MSNDPFSQFSKIFTNEIGRAAMTAWQEALTKSFGQAFAGFQPPSAGPSSPLDFFQQFLNQYPGAGSVGLDAANNYAAFGEFFQKYLDLFGKGMAPQELSEQMSAAFRDNIKQFSSVDNAPWMSFIQNLGGLANATDFFSFSEKFFQSNPFSGDHFATTKASKTTATFGPAREWQIAVANVTKAAQRYRLAQERMQEHTTKTFESASQKFWGEFGSGEGELKSLKDIYDYWVNCAEAAYYDIVMTDDYARDFGESINSQSALKRSFSALIDRFLEMLNIPNRRELDGVIQKMNGLETRLAALEENDLLPDAQTPLTNSKFEAELGDIQRQINELKLYQEGDSTGNLPTSRRQHDHQGKVGKTDKRPTKAGAKRAANSNAENTPGEKNKAKSKKKKPHTVAEFGIDQITGTN